MNNKSEIPNTTKYFGKKDFILPIVVLSLIFSFIYYHTFIWMFERFIVRDSYYSHGFLVPFLSIYLIWRRKKDIFEQKPSFSPIGILFLSIGIFIQLISSFWRIHFTSGFSMVFILLGVSYILLGKNICKYLFFPILYLVFMVPLPLVAIAEFSLRLKIFAATVGLKISELVGIVAIQEGAILHFKTGKLVIGDICSGLRSLIALLAFGAFYAYICKFSILKKLLLFAVSVPVALLANITRIIVLCIIAQIWGVDMTGGIVHDASGIFIFVIAFVLLFSFEKFLRLFGKK